ncbi:MAG: class I poly(R)-hydroxyalkanoic acid synthase, partial [Phenylobacterium sp.]
MSEQTSPSKAGKAKSAKGKTGKKADKAKAASKAANGTTPKPHPIPDAPPPIQASTGFEATAALTADQRAQMEKLSANLARAALAAQGAIAEMALRQADRPAALSPDPFHVAPALTEVMGRLAAQPDRLMRAQADLFSRYLDLWQNATRRISGEATEPVVGPAKGDKRFNDPDWEANPVFDVIKQSYLLTANWMNGLVAEVTDVDPMAKRRVEFFMKMLTDAFSPSNFLASNPAALREVMATGGESLVRGMDNFTADLERGGGQLSIAQTDYEMFKIGENVATAPGKVVFRNEIIELLQFSPTTDQVCEIPLVIFPPWINKFYILDLRPENSMIRWLASQGITVFVASWVNPTAELATRTFEDYMREGIYAGTQAAMQQCCVEQVNT